MHVYNDQQLLSLFYGAPAWWAYASTVDKVRIERVVERIRGTGYMPEEYTQALQKRLSRQK